MSYNGTSCNHHYSREKSGKKSDKLKLPNLGSLVQAANILKSMEEKSFLAKALRENLVEIQGTLKKHFSFNKAGGGICLKKALTCLEIAKSRITSTSPNGLPKKIKEKALRDIGRISQAIRHYMMEK